MKTILSIFFIVFALACASSETKPMSQAEWRGNMREISDSFSTLLKFAYSGDAFFDPKNKDTIEAEVKRMSTLATQIHEKGKNLQFDKDPVLKYVTRDFSRDMNIAYVEIKGGHPDFTRSIIKATSNYCISCHTRNDQGVKDNAGFLNADVSGLNNIDKADYLAAVRQFPKALDAYDNVLTNVKFAETNQRQWTTGMKKSLAIAVRVNRSPSLSLELVSRVFDARSVPLSLREAAITWRVAVKEWRDSEKNPVSLKEARLLISKAQNAIGNTWNSDAGLIYYLRASTILHDMLRSQKGMSETSVAEALYLSGLAAEGLKEINLWTFDEIYYESCIRYKPHSDTSKKCFARLEALQIFSPNFYMVDGAMKLRELRDLAL